MNEQALLFPCGEDTLVGILSLPATATTTDTAVIIVVGGPQYRAGSHRQFVLLARRLAAAGYAVLRFDYRGMGDSSGPVNTFLTADRDIGAAIEALQNQLPAVKSIVLWGLCDAASAALLYVHHTQDARVTGLCLLNPWVRSEASLARTQVKHYYIQRVMQRSFWSKLLSGQVALAALKGLAKNIRLSTSTRTSGTDKLPFQQQMAASWMDFGGHILLILSGSDYTAKEFLEYAATDAAWSKALQRQKLERQDLPGADHTFSNAEMKIHVENVTLNWLNTCLTGKMIPVNPGKV